MQLKIHSYDVIGRKMRARWKFILDFASTYERPKLEGLGLRLTAAK